MTLRPSLEQLIAQRSQRSRHLMALLESQISTLMQDRDLESVEHKRNLVHARAVSSDSELSNRLTASFNDAAKFFEKAEKDCREVLENLRANEANLNGRHPLPIYLRYKDVRREIENDRELRSVLGLGPRDAIPDNLREPAAVAIALGGRIPAALFRSFFRQLLDADASRQSLIQLYLLIDVDRLDLDPQRGLGRLIAHFGESRITSGYQVDRLRLPVDPLPPAPPPAPPPPSPPTISADYIKWLKDECTDVALRGLRPQTGLGIRLRHVYVPLTTTPSDAEREKGSRGDFPVETAAGILDLNWRPPTLLLHRLGESSLYVSGNPGSGKSTFCRWVTWLTCEGSVPAPDLNPPEYLWERFPASLLNRLPLLVRLREFSRELPSGDAGRGFGWQDLEAAIGTWIDRNPPPGLSGAGTLAHLHRGSVLLVLDGIDEVPPDRRAALIRALGDAVRTWDGRGHRILMTGRPFGLDPYDLAHIGLPSAPIQPLIDDLQRLLMRRWFGILETRRGEGEATAESLLREIAHQDWLRDFAANPLLLTALCIVYGHGKQLPEDRHELYDQVVDTVLHSHVPDPPRRRKLRAQLAVIAHGMHTGALLGESRESPQAEVTHDEIDRMLRAWKGASGREPDELEVQNDREDLIGQTGLLLPQGFDRAAFLHFSVQEFLAAQRMQVTDENQLVERFLEYAKHAEWRHTLGFVFGGVLRNVTNEPAERILTELLERLDTDTVGPQAVATDAAEMYLNRWERIRPTLNKQLCELWLKSMHGAAPARDRCRFGNALALVSDVGDPRFRAETWFLPSDDLLGFVEVPAGSFKMGSHWTRDRNDWTRDPEALASGQPSHELVLPTLYIGRFPVTVAQFEAFVNDSRFVPANPEWKRGTANHPVVFVSWLEAVAYCVWLDAKLRAWQGTRAGAALQAVGTRLQWRVTLPSEAEWEKAARGTDGRLYPWGDAADPEKANYASTGLGETSAVGCFGIGASPYGCLDMSGNVYEWTRSAHRRYPYSAHDGRESMEEGALSFRRVVRGGAFYDTNLGIRSASRYSCRPDYQGHSIGFRIVLSPVAADL